MAACPDGDDGKNGGEVGFATGDKKSGEVPSDGTSVDGPTINDARLDPTEIKEGEPLRLTVDFSDAQGDVSQLNFGIVGEPSHYGLASSLAAGQTSGSLLFELYPKNYVPGHYQLSVSLSDTAGNTSAAKTLPFIILNPDGSVPADASVDSGKDAGPGDDAGSDTIAPPSSPEFLMAYDGDPANSIPPALVRISSVGGQPQISTVSELVPHFQSSEFMDLRNGRVAMLLEPSQAPEGRGHIVAFDLTNPGQPWYVPIPSAPQDYHYTIMNKRPQVLPDKRIVLAVTLQTDNQYDDYHGDQLALWDPEADSIEVQGELSAFILAQPEIQSCNCDAEGGALNGTAFAASPDGNYVYFSAGSYGTEAMIHHGGPCVLARWVLSSKETERVVYTETESTPWAVSGDNSRVIVLHGGTIKLVDPVAKTMTDYDPYDTRVTVGQTATSGGTFIKGWRGCGAGAFGGVVLFNATGAQPYRVVDGEFLPSPHQGLQNNAQITADGSTLFFTASTDHCTNYASPFAVFQVPVAQENTAQAVKLMELEGPYLNNLFVLIR